MVNRRNPSGRPYAVSRLLEDDLEAGAPMDAMRGPGESGTMPMDGGAPYGGEPPAWSDGSALGLEESQRRAASRADWWATHGNPEQRRAAAAFTGSGLDQPFDADPRNALGPGSPAEQETMLNRFAAGQAAPADGARRGALGQLLDMPAVRTRMAFEGFNADRAAAGGDPNSVKDTFYRVMQGLDLGPEAFETWDGTTNAVANVIAPALREAGLEVLGTDKDKILIKTAENPGGEWVDVVRGAGAGGNAFWWGAGGGKAAAPPSGALPSPDLGMMTPGQIDPTTGQPLDPVTGAPMHAAAYRRLPGQDRAARRRSRVRDLLGPGPDRYDDAPMV